MSGLVQNYRGMKRIAPIRVLHEDIDRLTLGMLGDATRHIDTVISETGETLYRVEDIRDAAGVNWSAPLGKLESKVPIVKVSKKTIFHYTTAAGAKVLLQSIGTTQAHAVQQLMD